MTIPVTPDSPIKPSGYRPWQYLTRLWWWWITPRSTSRDLAFRERTIRATVVIMLFATAFAFISSIPVFDFHGGWISYPVLMGVTAFIFLLSAIAVSQVRVNEAGQLLVVALIVAASGVALIDGFWSSIVPPTLMLVILVTALVLPRSALLPTGVISVGLFSIFAFYQELSGRLPIPVDVNDQVTANAVVINVVFLVGVEVIFLRQLRLEFDDRLAAMAHSMHQTELAKEEADRANRAKSQFLASMTHEFRTPLNAIIGYADIMIAGMAGALSDKQIQINQHMRHNAKRLLGMINNVLDMAKIEAGRVEVLVAPMVPRQIIEEAVGSMSSLVENKNITLHTQFEDTLPESVIADLPKVQQILTNLIGNAIKFTMEGSITVGAGGQGEENWYFKVTDTGIGMPPEASTYIFEAFSQVEVPNHKSVEGTGLGLAICKQHIDLMGGSITVDTALGKGTTFTVVLPRTVKEITI